MISVIQRINIKAGRVLWQNKYFFTHSLKSFPDGDYTISVKEGKPTRSLEQNSYYWGVIVKILSEETGHSTNEIHEFLKHEFLPRRVVLGVEVVGSTKTLNTKDFETYAEQCRAWANTEMNCQIPLPNEVI